MLFSIVLGVTLVVISAVKNRTMTHHSTSEDTVTQLSHNHKSFPLKPKISTDQDRNNLENDKGVLVKLIDETRVPVSDGFSKIVLDKKKLIAWIRQNEFAKARYYLIKKASKAVDHQNNVVLGDVMHLLGRLSSIEGDLASTEVYLYEALDIFGELAKPQKIADTQLLLGRMYAQKREIARRAGTAYDDLLVARYYLNKGNPYQAKDILDSSIQENRELGRTGAVASAYKSLAAYYKKQNNFNDEQESLIEAGKYYADSGQANQAQAILNELSDKQASLGLMQSLELQINQKLTGYQSQVNLVRQAKDYMKLYNLYQSKGEKGRAWEFRVKASEILSRSDKRDMYHRMPDVMAVLYDSNTNLDKAFSFYKKASQTYLEHNNLESYNRVVAMQGILN